MNKFNLTLSIIILFVISIAANAQKKDGVTKETVLISNVAFIDKLHTIDDLNAMSKADLIKLYNERFKIVIQLLPYNALSNKTWYKP